MGRGGGRIHGATSSLPGRQRSHEESARDRASPSEEQEVRSTASCGTRQAAMGSGSQGSTEARVAHGAGGTERDGLAFATIEEAVQRVEAVSSEGRFGEAVPMLEGILQALRKEIAAGISRPNMHAAQAEIWAHLGVAHQSLGRMHEALASYGRAVALNPALHACFANLAALHSYLGNLEVARRHIDKALGISPGNEAYLQIREQLGPKDHDV